MKLTKKDVQNNVDSGSFRRGSSYFQDGKVQIQESRERSDGRGVKLQSTAQGSYNNEYYQHIDVRIPKGSTVDIDGRCTCPVRFNCKHVVAACLCYIESLTSNVNTASDDALSWIEQFASASHVEESVEGNNQFLCYILNKKTESDSMTVRIMVTHPLKKGGFSKPKPVPLHNLLSKFTRPSYATQTDLDIAQLINSLKGQQWLDYPIEGEIGYLALTKMVGTQHCYWQDITSPAITTGERREVVFTWQKQLPEHVKLLIQVAPEATILQTSPSLFLDSKHNEIGPLKGAAFTPQQWRLLNNIPAIPSKDVEDFSRKLMTTLPSIQLPPPVALTSINVNSAPIPVLRLMNKKANYGKQIHVMQLQYSYDEHRLSALPKQHLQAIAIDNKIYNISRDSHYESELENRLTALQFDARQFLDDNELYFVPKKNWKAMDVAAHWQQFIDDEIPKLRAEGCQVIIDNSFNLEFFEINNWEIHIEEKNEWFDLRFDLQIGKHKIPLLPLILKVLESYDIQQLPQTITVPINENKFIKLPSERIKPICQVLYELHDNVSLNRNGSLQLNRFDVGRLNDLEQEVAIGFHWQGGKALRELGKKLKNFQGLQDSPIPKDLHAELREYQHQGLNWLQFLREFNFGGILADDMGLGKTIQALANLQLEKEQGRLTQPSLIIAPTSLMGNWRREIEKFTPNISALILHGADRHENFAQINQHDVVITTYPLLVRDHEALLARDYYYLILDEAQNIKNNLSKTSQQVREVKAQHRLCLTGTPLENHLGELWSQFDFLMPGLLGNQHFFKRHFRTPIERQDDSVKQKQLAQRIAPFMLRRTKTEVVAELPPKTEIIRTVTLGNKQAALYESIRLSMESKVRKAIAQKGLARSHIMVLDALLKLRQTCCDPQLLNIPQAQHIKESAKLHMLMEMLHELIDEGRKILLFSQFTKMLAIIEQHVVDAGISYSKLTGQTRKRDEAIDKFVNGDADVFLISLKAGGVGLNLTEADTVILYDPWWNPASENQAADRAHRIGQNKAVFIYKLITENTVEEKILALQTKKRELAEGVFADKKQSQTLSITANDLDALFSPLLP